MRLSIIVLLSALFAAAASAQVGGGSIVGNVNDSSGAALAGAKVEARDKSTNARNEGTTNDSGYFEFPLLPAGVYELLIEKAGFQSQRSTEFTLNAGTRPRFDFKLGLQSVSETVQVSAIAPLVNSTSTELGNVIEQKKIQDLPLNGRNFQQLLSLQAGVVVAPPNPFSGRGGIEFHGSPSFGNNLLMDGVDMSFGENNAVAGDAAAGAGTGGALIQGLSVEAIQELKSTGSAFSAEYGRATGGVVNVTTKSGGNRFHGTLFEYFRNNKLDANNFFSNRVGIARAPLRWNQYGGNLSGPIRRDKLFFFFNYEGAQVRRGQAVSGFVPTPLLLSRVSPAIRQNLDGLPKDFTATTNPLLGFHQRNDNRSNDENTILARTDWYVNQRHRVAVRYNYNWQDFSSANLRPENRFLYPNRVHNAVIQETWTISPAIVNEVRLGYARTSLNRQNTTLYTLPGWVEVAAGGLVSDFQSRINFFGNSYTLADNLTWIRGRHTIKAGFEIRELRSSRIQQTNPTHFYNTLDDLIADRSNTVRVTFGNPGRGLDTTNYGFFVQDDFRLSNRLQINAGLRYEYFTPLKGAFNVTTPDPFGPVNNNAGSLWKPDRNNFGPRLGVIFDVRGDQRTILRAGGTITYAAPQPFFFYDMSFISPQVPFNAVFSQSDVPPDVSLAFPFPQDAFVNRILSGGASLPSGLLLGRGLVDTDRRDEYSGQWNVSLQQALTRSTSLQLSYVANRALKLYSSVFPNQFLPGAPARPRPDIGDITYRVGAASSSYHALEVSFNQRAWKGLTLDGYYTWSKTMAYLGADGTFTNDGTVQDPNNWRGSYGPKVGNTPHRFRLIHSYLLPNSRFARVATNGWSLEGIFSAFSGTSLNVSSGVDFVNNRRPGGQRPDSTGIDYYLRDTEASTFNWLNPAAFSNAIPRAQQRFGNLGFNAVYGPGQWIYDLAAHKVWKVLDYGSLDFRLEAFSVFNHRTLGNPDTNYSSPNFGKILGGGGNRNVQLALKYRF